MKTFILNTKMKYYIILFVLLYFTVNLNAQQVDVESKPSHFLFPVFHDGIVKMKSGASINAVMDYNTVTQEMIFEKDGNRLAFSEIESIDTVYLLERKFIPFEKIFLEVLVEKNIGLFIQHKCNLISSGKDIGYGKSQTTSSVSYTELLGDNGIYKFELPNDFYVVDASVIWISRDGKLVKVNTERKLLKLFSDKKSELEKYIKENNILFSKGSGLVKLIEYCNELYY